MSQKGESEKFSTHEKIAGKRLDPLQQSQSGRDSGAGRVSNGLFDLNASRRNQGKAIDKATEEIFKDTDDPEMYFQLGIVRPKDLRNLSKYDREKIYEYCVARDEKIFLEKTGGINKRNAAYAAAKRKEDPK
jgi:hypothetical protein